MRWILAIATCVCLTSDVDAWTHGRAMQPSSDTLVTNSNDPLTTDAGDILVTP